MLYPLTAALGILLSAWAWERLPLVDTAPTAQQRHAIFVGSLIGMVAGAKLAYLASEAFLDALDTSLSWLTRGAMLLQGKSVTGALLGGYLGVEFAKRHVGYEHATGDTFALLTPRSAWRWAAWAVCRRVVVLASPCASGCGRSGRHALPLEFVFNALFFGWVVWISRRRQRGVADTLRSQLFHVYLVTYGAFRFAHEFMRDTPRLWGVFSGYQVFALATLALGLHGCNARRRRKSALQWQEPNACSFKPFSTASTLRCSRTSAKAAWRVTSPLWRACPPINSASRSVR
jgi:phosphatidylglycerol:prolipoprotein diacylglycerol transferase